MSKNVRLFTINSENLKELLTLNGIYPVIDNFDGEKHTYHYAKSDEFYDIFNNRNLQVTKEDLLYVFDRDRCKALMEAGNRLFKVRTSREGGFMYLLIRKDAIGKYIVSAENEEFHKKFIETTNLPKEKKSKRRPIKDLDKALETLKEDYSDRVASIKKRDRR